MAGLGILSAEMMTELQSRAATLEDKAMWDRIRQSDLSGTRWRLIALNNTGITVYDSKTAAKTGSGIGVWAELNLMGVGGGTLTLAGNESLQKLLNMRQSTALFSFPWEPDDVGGFRIRSYEYLSRDADIQLNLENITIARDASEITVTFPDGAQAVFQKQ